MTDTAVRPPHDDKLDEQAERGPAQKLKVSFSGPKGFGPIRDAAASAALAPVEFVRKAVRLGIYVQDMQRRGFTPVMRNDHGTEFILPPDLRFG